MHLSVVVATFGDNSWKRTAESCAIPSIESQTRQPHELIVYHGDTLASARNEAAKAATGDFVCFVDADDELDRGYVAAMRSHFLPYSPYSGGWASDDDIVQPSTLGIVNGVEDDTPVLIPQTDLTRSNYIVIGAPVNRDLFWQVGGFDELPILEDWALWLKCFKAGAQIGSCPEAVYRVNVHAGSRNTDRKLHGRVYKQIRQMHA